MIDMSGRRVDSAPFVSGLMRRRRLTGKQSPRKVGLQPSLPPQLPACSSSQRWVCAEPGGSLRVGDSLLPTDEDVLFDPSDAVFSETAARSGAS